MKRFVILASICLLPVFLFGCAAEAASRGASSAREAPPAGAQGSAAPTPAPTYGVYVGATPEDMGRIPPCDVLVIDGAYFTARQIAQLRQPGGAVYSYLNIGSLETFRDIYPRFRDMALDAYDNWPEEYWMDVSRPAWQSYLVDTAAEELDGKGVDGFFLDNADVYYQYPTPEIFDGLVQIIQGLSRYGKPLIINGGDVFVSRAVLDAPQPLFAVTGVNQECVFTHIDFDTGTLARQQPDTTQYYQQYLQRCKQQGLAVYLTEYAPADDEDLQAAIRGYCEEAGYLCHIASSIQLDGDG